MSVQSDYYIPQLERADEQISRQASEITKLRAALKGLLRFCDEATLYELEHARDYSAYLDAAALVPNSSSRGEGVMDPTARGDMIAEKVRAWYEANREIWWDRHNYPFRQGYPDRAGVTADNFILSLIQAVHQADEETPR